jgi:formylglycine-generating enzyme required for sulfatase activity
MKARGILGASVVLAIAVAGCSGDDEGSSWAWGGSDGGGEAEASAGDVENEAVVDGDLEVEVEAEPDAPDAGPCPADMVLVEDWCIDRFEAPNRDGAMPLVMYHFDEAESWCMYRGKRLCFDDEWTRVCGGKEGLAYPYGDSNDPGVCTDDKVWLSYNQELLNGWPWSIDTDVIESVEDLLGAAREKGAAATAAADHVQWLYQAEPSGSKTGCTTGDGAYDLSGNIEEWTRRRSGGTTDFHGNLKGRYWAEARTCQQSVITHGDLFRFYEIGFRCCRDP